MLQKLKQMYLRARIDSARTDLELSMLLMRDSARRVHMHANRLEALLAQAGHVKRDHFSMVEIGLAHHEANRNIRASTRHNDLLVTPAPIKTLKDDHD